VGISVASIKRRPVVDSVATALASKEGAAVRASVRDSVGISVASIKRRPRKLLVASVAKDVVSILGATVPGRLRMAGSVADSVATSEGAVVRNRCSAATYAQSDLWGAAASDTRSRRTVFRENILSVLVRYEV